MKRRRFLRGAGTAGVVATGGVGLGSVLGDGDARETFESKVWLSADATDYAGAFERVRAYLEGAFGEAFESVEVDRGPTVSVSTQDAAELMWRLEWPRRLLGAAASGEALAADLNLLLTDGSMRRSPTGIGVAHVAAVGGASHVARVGAPGADPVVPYSVPRGVMQVALHEAGHAVGLAHDHGTVQRRDGDLVVSPMVSTYPWSPPAVKTDQFDFEEDACGGRYPPVQSWPPRLRMTFSDCALARLAAYDGGISVRAALTRFVGPGVR